MSDKVTTSSDQPRVIQRPINIHPCPGIANGCSDMVEAVDDGISVRYNCRTCGQMIGDIIIGAEP